MILTFNLILQVFKIVLYRVQKYFKHRRDLVFD